MEPGFHSLHFSPMFGGAVALPEIVEAAAAAGFSSIGLDGPAVDAELAAGRTLAAIGALLRDHRLSCTDVAVVPIQRDPRAVAAAAGHLGAIAAVVGAELCVVAVPESTPPMPWPDVVSHARLAAEILHPQHVRLAVEFTPYSRLSNLADAVALCDAVGWARAGLVLDSLHGARAGTSMADIRALDASQIALVQLSDAPAVAPVAPFDLVLESRHGRLVPGEGALPLAAFVEAVRSTGFDGPFAAEVLSAELRTLDPTTVARRIRAGLLPFVPTPLPKEISR